MAKFKLTPVADRLSDPLWQHSDPPHEACYVGARDEQEAREIAAAHFHPMYRREGVEKIPTESPWLDPGLTTCESVPEIGMARMSDGVVQRASEGVHL
jgi:hypothetical protein